MECVFIDAGYMDSQLLYVIPIVDGFCISRNIHSIIFERAIPKEVRDLDKIKEILSKYTIIEIEKNRFGKFYMLTMILINIFPAITLAIKVSTKNMRINDDWFNFNVLHAVWDQARTSTKDGKITLPFYSKFKSSLIVKIAIKKTNNLINNYKIIAAFLGHKVYAGRGVLAEFHRHNIEIYTHGDNLVFRFDPVSKSELLSFSPEQLEAILEFVSDSTVDKFWLTRKKGVSPIFEFTYASKRKKIIDRGTPKNIILLHIFRDSPFFDLDKERIFIEYVDWLQKTLEIISSSNEDWLIKTHPSSERWGEDQQKWLKVLRKNVFNNKSWPKNITISDGEYSNMDLFDYCHRVVTFNGTGHLEAACFGVKPIVINDVILSTLGESNVLKASTIEQYADYLLKSSSSETFKLSEIMQVKARKLLFLREHKLTFAKDVGWIGVLRGDSASVFQENLNLVKENVNKFADNLTLQGKSLASGMSRTVSADFYDFWKNIDPSHIRDFKH